MGSKIMMFGASGQLGVHLVETASGSGHCIVALTHRDADICDRDAVAAAIAKYAPSVIVNAAAYTAVDKAEGEEDRAFQVNRDGAGILAEEAVKANVPLIHLSTDYVFDGSARVPYDEEHEVNPQGAYARSKEAGERAVRDAHSKHLILRTASVYGPFGTNFVKTMLRLGPERDSFASSTTRPGAPPRPAILPRRSSPSRTAPRSLASPIGALITMPAPTELYPIPPKPETQGRTEAIIGIWLSSRRARDKVMIATKAIGRSKMTWLRKDGLPGRQSRAQLIEALEGSLRRLKTDYVDLYQLHWPDRPMRIFQGLDYVHKEGDSHAIKDILGVLGAFVDQGKIRFVDLSNETPWGVMTFLKAAEALGLPRIVSVQNAFNLVNRSFEIGLAEIFYREQVSLLGYSPLGQGYLSGKYEDGALPEGSRKLLFDRLGRYEIGNGPRAISAYVALARKHGIDPAQMALAFATSRPFVTSTIIGATTLDQLRTDIDGCLMTLPDAVLADIEQLHLAYPNPCP